MYRINIKQIEKLIDRLNETAGTPKSAYTKNSDGRLVPNPDHFYLAQAYGGCKLEQICKGGGARDPISMGFVTKRECFDLVSAYLNGMESAK